MIRPRKYGLGRFLRPIGPWSLHCCDCREPVVLWDGELADVIPIRHGACALIPHTCHCSYLIRLPILGSEVCEPVGTEA